MPATTPSDKNVSQVCPVCMAALQHVLLILQLKKGHTVKNKSQGKSPRKPGYKRSHSLPQDEDSIFNVLNWCNMYINVQ